MYGEVQYAQGKLLCFDSVHLLSWQVLGAVGTLPEIYTELEISYFLLRRLLGVRTEGDKKGAKVSVPLCVENPPGMKCNSKQLKTSML